MVTNSDFKENGKHPAYNNWILRYRPHNHVDPQTTLILCQIHLTDILVL